MVSEEFTVRLEKWAGGPNHEQDDAFHVIINGITQSYYRTPTEAAAIIEIAARQHMRKMQGRM
jgi:hypothetical protein